MSEDSAERIVGIGKKPFPDAIEAVFDALRRLKFGAIQLTVHEGKLVQVDITDRDLFSNQPQ